eukprot:TRINITY_DN3271_c0_g3_i2.p1 TRINITY_DN3271_c0_g3~~TRINITY_DN3271_c0_g3_i2.p1  ORF type:complete len:538 (-),score=164.33 TRINITY_DN3271_c0_g3_i2:290-1903(-)
MAYRLRLLRTVRRAGRIQTISRAGSGCNAQYALDAAIATESNACREERLSTFCNQYVKVSWHGIRLEKPSLQRRMPYSAAAAADFPPHVVLSMPSLSPTMTQGNIVEWKKKEGDEVAAGDVLFVLETDKATLENEAQDEGFLAKILVSAGSKDVSVSTPIAILVENADDIPKFVDYAGAAAPQASAPSPPAAEPKEQASAVPPHHLGPSVKMLLEESGLDPYSITGTGPHSIITKGDVLAAIEGRGTAAGPPKLPSAAPLSAPPPPPSTPAKPAPAAAAAAAAPPPPPPAPAAPPKPTVELLAQGSFVDIPTSQIRQIIAQRLLESKRGSPHFYVEAEAEIDATLALRKELKDSYSVAVSVNDFVIKAVAMALKEVKEANVYWDEAKGDIVSNTSVDISVAVATDKGLITPIVRNADKKSLKDISLEVKSLVQKARDGRLKPAEFQGGTFSISNLGMFGIDRFSAIINPPQSGILAIGQGAKTLAAKPGPDGKVGTASVTKMEVTLSADYRAVQGEVAGKLLSAVAANLRDPKRLLI